VPYLKILLKAFVFIIAITFVPSDTFAEKADVGRHIIFIVDFSGSVKENLKTYWETISLVTGCAKDYTDKNDSELCNKIQEKDCVTILKITGHSRREPEIVANAYFRKKGFLENKLKYNIKMAEKKKKFIDAIQNTFKSPVLANNTEILAAIRLSQQYFNDIRGEDKILIILSDMIEESEFYNFRKRKVKPDIILNKEDKAHRLPNLNGVRVYISDATARSDVKFDEIKRFWVMYFEKTGALLDNNYRSRMIHFE